MTGVQTCALPIYSDMTILELYDELGVSNRYFTYLPGVPEPIGTHYGSSVNSRSEVIDKEMVTVFETPHGELLEKKVMTR